MAGKPRADDYARTLAQGYTAPMRAAASTKRQVTIATNRESAKRQQAFDQIAASRPKQNREG